MERNMKKIMEIRIDTDSDRDSATRLLELLEHYSTENDYRIETFFSPKFIRVTIYDLKTER